MLDSGKSIIMISLDSIGLKLIENFLSEQEEQNILSNLKMSEKSSGPIRSSIKRYGSDIPYKNQVISKSIPEFLHSISIKLVQESFLDTIPDSLSINEYQIGNAIAPHIDSLSSGPIITIISLLSDATMVFSKNEISIDQLIPARSLVQMSGPLRYEWEHAIKPVKNLRYSIVFRLGQKV
jgi:alkylated DNA repair dioxygenase AlkB